MKTEIMVSNDSKHNNLQLSALHPEFEIPVRSYLPTLIPNQGSYKVQEYFHFSSSFLSVWQETCLALQSWVFIFVGEPS